MRLLLSSTATHRELLRAIGKYSRYHWAVAWGGIGFDGFERLGRMTKRISRMVVGTHFYQTHPNFIARFRTLRSARFITNPSGVFHPKVYFFENSPVDWCCILGSSNFTAGGMEGNDETGILFGSNDHGTPADRTNILRVIDGYWRRAKRMSAKDLDDYRIAWQQRSRNHMTLGAAYESKARRPGKSPSEILVMKMTWKAFYNRVAREGGIPDRHKALKSRLAVVEQARNLFKQYEHFSAMPYADRKRIAGITTRGGPDHDWLWFGSMKGVGTFLHAVKANARGLSLALDQIPAIGPVDRKDYNSYVSLFHKAIPDGRLHLAAATRLLAMKRPDCFVCIDSPNRKGLCGMVGIPQKIGFEQYWDSIICRIQDSLWWGSSCPPHGNERKVWEARAAFLDALTYSA